jgi:hypothetical protein
LLASRRLASDFGGLAYLPKGHVNRQLVSEKDLNNTIVSKACNRASPAPLSSAAFLPASAVKSIGERAIAGSASLWVTCPLPTRIGTLVSSISKPPMQLIYFDKFIIFNLTI